MQCERLSAVWAAEVLRLVDCRLSIVDRWSTGPSVDIWYTVPYFHPVLQQLLCINAVTYRTDIVDLETLGTTKSKRSRD